MCMRWPAACAQECVGLFEALHTECAALGAGEAELGMLGANIKFARQAPSEKQTCALGRSAPANKKKGVPEL